MAVRAVLDLLGIGDPNVTYVASLCCLRSRFRTRDSASFFMAKAAH